MKIRSICTFLCAILLFTGCQKMKTIVSGIPEKEANIIVVFLESKGIPAEKEVMVVSGAAAAGGGGPKYDILVDEKKSVEALSILNRNGLPRTQGTTLLELFAKQGLMSSEKEENIRYHAGLAQQLTNTIMLMDGVIDASVQLSFPETSATPGEEQTEKITAAVYVKHQGILDDPHSHLDNKIKRLISGSVTGLDINDVTVVSDRSRLTEATPIEVEDAMRTGRSDQKYVSIWSIIMSRESAGKFKAIFFFCLLFTILFALLFAWMLWKIYPALKQRGFKELLKAAPLVTEMATPAPTPIAEESPPPAQDKPPQEKSPPTEEE